MFISIQDIFIKNALEYLEKGEVIAFPTDTVYGLGVALNSPHAAEKIYNLKQRDLHKPLVVYVNELEDIEKVSGLPLSPQEKALAATFLPGPITLLVKHSNPQFSHQYLGFRVISSPILQRLIEQAGPLLGTSANISNFPPAITSEEVLEDFSDKNIFVIPGQCHYGLESTVVGAHPPKIYREGIISKEAISHVLPGSMDYCTQRTFDSYIKVYTVKNQEYLNDFLRIYPHFQGVICCNPTPRDFYPMLRKALRLAKQPEVVFLYDPQTSIYPELSVYLLPYTFNPTRTPL